jgi:hypothetical protein
MSLIQDQLQQRHPPGERPDPEWVRGRCPMCGEDVVSNAYYVAGKGYLIIWECWASLEDEPRCDYRRVL